MAKVRIRVCTLILFCLLLFLFCCFLAPWLLLSRRYCFSCLGCRAVLRFSLPFLILADAIFNAAVHFIAVQPAISRLIIQGWTLSYRFLLWSCRRHIHFATKDVFVVTTSCRPIFFFLFWLSFFSSFSCRHAVPIVTVQPVAIHIL